MRYHLDEHIDSAIARGLRLRGINVTTSHEAGLLGASDEVQLAYSLDQQRVIYTNDVDFLELGGAGIHHAGIVYSHRQAANVGQVIRYL